MALFENFPYTNLHELNLGWILKKISEAYSPDNPPSAMVISVNGESGEVILYKDAIIKFPDVVDTQWNMWRNADGTATGVQFEKDQPMKRINGNSRFVIYDAGNPPPYPVVSVNGETGEIELYTEAYVEFPSIEDNNWGMQRKLNADTANEVRIGIMFDDTGKAYITKDEDSVEIYAQDNPPPYPVTSVDGNTGAVSTWGNTTLPDAKMPTRSNADNWSISRDITSGSMSIKLMYDSNIDTVSAYLVFNDGVNTPVPLKLLTVDDIPSSSGVVSFNGQTGVLTITGADLKANSNTNDTIDDVLTSLASSITSGDSNLQGQITSIKALLESMLIFVDGHTAEKNITTGDYIYLLNSDIQGLTNGVYVATSDVLASVTLTAGDLTVYTGTNLIGDLFKNKATKTEVQTLESTINAELTQMNVVCCERIVREQVTTGASGNLLTPYSNTGTDFIVAPLVVGNDYYIIPWVNASGNRWYLTVYDKNTGLTVNNATIDIRYLHIKLASANQILPTPV